MNNAHKKNGRPGNGAPIFFLLKSIETLENNGFFFFVQVIVDKGVFAVVFFFIFYDKRSENRLSILRKFHHTGQNIGKLERFARGATTLAIDFHNEQTRMHLSERALTLNDFRTTHILANTQTLTHQSIQRIMDGVNNQCLLLQINSLYPCEKTYNNANK